MAQLLPFSYPRKQIYNLNYVQVWPICYAALQLLCVDSFISVTAYKLYKSYVSNAPSVL